MNDVIRHTRSTAYGRVVLSATLLFAACVLFVSGVPARAAALSSTSTVTAVMTSPAAGSTMNGTVTLKASVSGQAAKLIFQVTPSGGTAIVVPGNIDPNDATSYDGTWDSTTVPDGTYSVTATVTASDGSTSTSPAVQFTIANKTAVQFTVGITSPTPGSTQHGVVGLAATTSTSADGVTFMFTSAPVGANVPSITAVSDPQATQWTANWDSTAFPSGAYTLTAVANGSGVAVDSTPVDITVDNPPTVTVTAPAGGTTISASTTVSAGTTAPVDGVTFQLFATDGTAVKSVPGNDAGGRVSWNGSLDPTGVPDGSYQLIAVASVSGSSVKSLPVDVTVSTGTATAPSSGSTTDATVTVVSPSPASTVSGGVTVAATTTGTVLGVTFTVNAQPSTPAFTPVVINASSADNTKWTATWDSSTAPDGTYTVMAGADANGVNIGSDQVSFVVSNGNVQQGTSTGTTVPLVVTVTAPTGGDIAGGAELAATSVPDASSLRFYVINTDTGSLLSVLSTTFDASTSAWTAAFPPDPVPGNYQIKAVATDAAGNAYGSTPVAVTVGAATSSDTSTPVLSVTEPSAQSTVSGSVKFQANVSGTVGSMEFLLVSSTDPANSFTVVGSLNADGTWGGTWDSTVATDDAYLVTAVATLADGTKVQSVRSPFAVQNAPVPTAPTPLSAATMQAPAAGVQVSGQVTLVASTKGDAERVHFTVTRSGGTVPPDDVTAVLDTSNGSWRTTWDATSMAAGEYSIVAFASAGTVTVKSDPVVIDVVSPSVAPPECSIDADCADGQVCTGGACVAATVPAATSVTAPVTGAAPSPVTVPMKAVSVTSPRSGNVQGIVMLVASASDLVDVSFTVSASSTGTPLFSRSAALDKEKDVWVSYWDASNDTPGDYTVVAGGTDTSGARIVSDPVAVTVTVAPTAETAPPAPTEVPQSVVRDVIFQVPAGKAALQRPELSKAVLEPDVTLRGECDKAGIAPADCGAWLRTKYVDPSCRAAGIVTKEECIAYLRAAHGGTVQGCGSASTAACDKVMTEKTAGLMPAVELDAIEKGITPMIGNTVNFQRTDVPGQPQGTVPAAVADRIPVPAVATQVSLHVQASPAYAATDASTVHREVPAVLFIDSDGDGLPDDTERRIGTDPHKADTDGDGVSDLQEIRNGTNPLGPGALPANMRFAPIDRAIIAGVPIAQPTSAGSVSSDLSVVAAAATSSSSGVVPAASPVTFTGHGTPGDVVTLYVYSYLPVVMTTTVDANGDWTYDLQNGLVSGEHQVYVTVTDDTGKVQEKSDPLSFVVSAAAAMTVGDAAANAAPASVPSTFASASADTSSMLRWYLIGVAALLVLGIVLGIIIVLRGRKR